MKKAQILSVIALAAALGVIAPVASVSAYKEPANGDHGTATCADSKNAAKAIENSNRYKNVVDFKDAAEDVDAATKLFDGSSVRDDVTAIVNAYDALKVLTGDRGQYFVSTKMQANNNKINNYPTTVATTEWTIDHLKDALTAAKGTWGYDKMLKVWKAFRNTNKQDFMNAVAGYNDVVSTNILDADAAWTAGEAALGHPYSDFKNLFDVVEGDNGIQAAYDDYTSDLKTLNSIYAKMKSAGQINETGAADYKTKIADAKVPMVGDLIAIVLDNAGEINTANVAGAGELIALETAVEDLKACNVASDNGITYDRIIDASYYYGRANGIEVATDAQKRAVARTLVNYAEPKDEDNTDTTIDAPQSGILGMAEGSASAVSIAAGLATALTALGAGVVAYRSARRSK